MHAKFHKDQTNDNKKKNFLLERDVPFNMLKKQK